MRELGMSSEKLPKGKIIVVVAPSGTGKSTLIKRLKEDFKNLNESVSFTTRTIRPGEIHGVHYNFIDVPSFKKKIDQGDFLEWAQVHSNFYGTSKQFVEDAVAAGKDLLLDLDVQGTDALKSHFKDAAKAIFIAPPSIEELEKRLRNRGTETEESINRRIGNAKKEILRQHSYDYRVLNDDFDRAYRILSNIVEEILRGA